jgi:hypothetical protein
VTSIETRRRLIGAAQKAGFRPGRLASRWPRRECLSRYASALLLVLIGG